MPEHKQHASTRKWAQCRENANEGRRIAKQTKLIQNECESGIGFQPLANSEGDKG